jgi:TnpA family transposase
MRLVASLKAGHVAPSTMLRKLAAYERQNQLDVGLQEIGKPERTLFMLDWLENPALRLRCQAGLNQSEQRHALTQAICTFRQGRIIDRSHEAQQYRHPASISSSLQSSIGIPPTWQMPLRICVQPEML